MSLFSKSEKQGLWSLATKDSDKENCIDIFAIHGLGGDKFRTWTDNGKLWLRDFLPEQLPEARIFTYGYDSTVAFSKSSAEVDDFARDFLHRVNLVRNSRAELTRPIVFICHSLGGLLFKQALVICSNDQKYRHLLEKFHGVVFMGTPHGGSDIAFWASYAGNLINAISFGTRTNKDLLGVLRKDSAFLGSLSQKFILQSRSMHILSFYETEKFPMLNCRIVDKESAHLNVSNETFLPIKADHRTMCHFSDSTSQKYISTISAIVNLARTSAEATVSLEPPLLRYREELNKWLDPLPMADDYNRICHLRLENTCEWINQEPKFLSWRNSNRRNAGLWVRGPPGCGKSTLAASIIDQLSMEQPTAYFFCNVEDPDRSDFTRILRTLTWQLIVKKPHLVDGIYDIYLETAGATTPIESYKRALASLLKDGEPCYVIIDGLDECRGKHADISKAIFYISAYAKLLVTSRRETWIQLCFPLGQMTSTLDIATTHTSEDLQRFVHDKSRELDLDPALAAELATLLIAKARGMFLWVKLTIEYLSQQVTLQDTVEALKDLPEGLETLYERLVHRLQMLPPSRYNLACKLMQWTFSSLRPLSLEQLKVALSITPGDNRQKNPNNVLNLEKFVRDSCSPLLELDEAKGTVRFVHASAVDFFSRATALDGFVQGDDLAFVPRVANSYCASVCLTYLSATEIGFVPEDRDLHVYSRNLDNYLDRYPFLQYCASNWWKHLPPPQSESDKNKEELANAIRSFTSSQKCLVRWIQLFQLLDGFREVEAPQATLFRSPESLYAWIFADNDSLFHHLWRAPSGLSTRWQRWKTESFFNGRYSTPIGIASFFDFLDVVRSECGRGKDINAQDRIGYSPAILAAHGESPNVLQYAMENGASVALTSVMGYGIARYGARNCASILPRILAWGAPVAISTLDDGATPIHAACTTAGVHPSILPQLLEKSSSTELDTKDFEGRTALHHAASIKIQSYARLVFDRGMLTAGALPQHRRLHTSSTEEAFMPSTRAEVETWLHSWNSYFATESNGADSESLAWHTSEFNEDSIARVVRKIKASMIIWLVESGASIAETDSEGRTALDIVLNTGFAEDLEVIDDYCLRRLSRALVALGAIETNPNGPVALEIALMRGHRVTVKAILKGGGATSKLSDNDQRFLSTFMHQKTEAQKDPTPESEKQYQPQSSVVALHTSYILRFCLKRYSKPLRYDESTYVKLSTMIVDFAEYWVKSGDSAKSSEERRRGGQHPVQSSSNKIEVSVPIMEGKLRNVAIYVLSPSDLQWEGDTWASIDDSRSASRHLEDTASSILSRIVKRPRHLVPNMRQAPILEMIRRAEDSAGASLLDQVRQGLGQGDTVMVPSKSFELDDCGRRWEQTWELPLDMGDGVEFGLQGITKWQQWLLSLSPRDTITLRPTQDFFANDVALYGGFGLEIYCAWV